MAKYKTTLVKKEKIAEGTMRFDFMKPSGFTYQAGQTIDVTILDPKESDTDGNTRAFSLISKPSDETIAIATRIRNSAFKRNLQSLPEGTGIAITGPFGSFTLHENTLRPAVFLAGGIGITPFHSIITDALEKNLPHALFLFYANRRPEDASFLSELEGFKKEKPNFYFIPTMTNVSQSKIRWEGEEGYINETMLTTHLPKDSLPIYYLAGPSTMLASLREMLKQSGVSGDDIKFEEFAGY